MPLATAFSHLPRDVSLGVVQCLSSAPSLPSAMSITSAKGKSGVWKQTEAMHGWGIDGMCSACQCSKVVGMSALLSGSRQHRLSGRLGLFLLGSSLLAE